MKSYREYNEIQLSKYCPHVHGHCRFDCNYFVKTSWINVRKCTAQYLKPAYCKKV